MFDRVEIIREKIRRTIEGPHAITLVDDKPVQRITFSNEHAISISELLHEDIPWLLDTIRDCSAM